MPPIRLPASPVSSTGLRPRSRRGAFLEGVICDICQQTNGLPGSILPGPPPRAPNPAPAWNSRNGLSPCFLGTSPTEGEQPIPRGAQGGRRGRLTTGTPKTPESAFPGVRASCPRICLFAGCRRPARQMRNPARRRGNNARALRTPAHRIMGHTLLAYSDASVPPCPAPCGLPSAAEGTGIVPVVRRRPAAACSALSSKSIRCGTAILPRFTSVHANLYYSKLLIALVLIVLYPFVVSKRACGPQRDRLPAAAAARHRQGARRSWHERMDAQR